MNDDTLDNENPDFSDEELENQEHTDYQPVERFDASAVHHLSTMYRSWFLDYASYVILERAVPHIEDGLKPVQRRILHSMKRMDDGRYNKVANIVGHTMQFHPHGDASIGDALVQMGQKDLMIDTQGNWGNILTGDQAAAPRYIEARLSKFALDILFNPKTTQWKLSYDGRNKEPITLPAKFPILLAQGAQGIAVGLSSKVLPHNLNELCDAAIKYLGGEEFKLYPDFPTGGSIDVSKYNDGMRGGSLKVRARIEKMDSKTLVIKEMPYSRTTTTLIDSILKAIDKGKIKARKVDDNTAANVEIQVHLAPGVSADKTIDALYAFTDCEINISPNCCVIKDDKPCFMSVSDVLKDNTDRTKALLRQELLIRKNELEDQLFFASLEKIFIEERIYKDKDFENAQNLTAVVKHIDERLEPFKKNLIRKVTREDIVKLLEIKMQRILKFNSDKADKLIAEMQKEIERIDNDLNHMVDVTIEWFRYIKRKYGERYPRLTEIKNFETIEATKVVERNEKLYINRAEGFIGTGLKKDEFICNSSDIDDVIIFYRDGKYKIIRIAEKIFVGKNVIYAYVFKKNDKRKIYNVVYRDGQKGYYYIKRFNVTSFTLDKEYDLTQGKPGSRVMYFSANPNGEAEVVKITLDIVPTGKRQNIFLEKDFADILIKGKEAKGNLLSKKPIHRIVLKSRGHSTLGGRKVWFDTDVNRINYEERGKFLGEFNDTDSILVVMGNGDFYLNSISPNSHFEDNIQIIEKWDSRKVWTAVLIDNDNNGYPYMKRFTMEAKKKPQNYLGENAGNKLICLTDTPYPRFKITYGGNDAGRPDEIIDAEDFIGVKGFKAKGKRVSTWEVKNIEEIEPTKFPEETGENPESEPAEDREDEAEEENLDPEKGKSQQQIIDEMTGQLSLFPDEQDK